MMNESCFEWQRGVTSAWDSITIGYRARTHADSSPYPPHPHSAPRPHPTPPHLLLAKFLYPLDPQSPDESYHEWQTTINENPIYYYTWGFPLKREHLWGLGTGLATAFAYAMLEHAIGD